MLMLIYVRCTETSLLSNKPAKTTLFVDNMPMLCLPRAHNSIFFLATAISTHAQTHAHDSWCPAHVAQSLSTVLDKRHKLNVYSQASLQWLLEVDFRESGAPKTSFGCYQISTVGTVLTSTQLTTTEIVTTTIARFLTASWATCFP